MNVLLVSYELNAKPKEQYMELYSALKTANLWWHYIESIWLIATPKSPKEWHEILAPKITQSDRLLIIEVKPNYYGWLVQEAWDWFSKAFKL